MFVFQDRISTQVAVERFRSKLNNAKAKAEELRVVASDAQADAVETKSKFLRVAKKMSIPARMRANAQVVMQTDAAAAKAAAGTPRL